MKLAFWTVLCKTPDCGKRHLTKLIGKSQKTAKYLLEGDLPQEFHYHCGKCDKAHGYTVEDMVPFDLTNRNYATYMSGGRRNPQ